MSYYLSHPIQYFTPLLRQLDQVFDLHVFYFSDASIRGNRDVGFNRNIKWDIPLLEGHSYSFLKNISGKKSLTNKFWDVVNPGVLGSMRKKSSSIIMLNGWSYFSDLLAIFSAKMMGRQVWLRAENPLNQELQKGKMTLRVKKLLFKHLLFPCVNKFLYIGEENKLFFQYYGVPASKFVYTPYAVDNKAFRQAKESFGSKGGLKRSLGLPQDHQLILFCGKFIDKKRPMDLLKAFAMLDFRSVALVMVGDGPLMKMVDAFLKEHNLKNVFLPGFVNQSAIAQYYAAADLFVMCSGVGETWGLAVNEAMNFSLPVIVSKTCGCSRDLVHENKNGFLFEEGDTAGLKKYLQTLLENDKLRQEFGRNSLEIIDSYTIEHIVRNLRQAVD